MKFVIKDGTVLIGGAEVSDHIRQVAVQMDKEKVKATGLNGNGVEEEIPGLATEGFEMELAGDFAAASVDAIVFPMYRDETIATISVQMNTPDGAGPTFSAPCRVFGYHPVDGTVGALSTTKLTFSAIEGIART